MGLKGALDETSTICKTFLLLALRVSADALEDVEATPMNALLVMGS